ncbi:hypothetical protein MFUL124B02_19870 [Myxococcus fulvus 124B02]|nr:hypothetical protein MFUL124B02_19870 [Myxococcus fulvus 124B02]
MQEATTIRQPGLLRAIFAAKPQADERAKKVERFRRWATHEALPSPARGRGIT